jgi:hypothetical protein
MSKKSSKKKEVSERNNDVAEENHSTRSPMKPFVERMIGRAEVIYTKASEVELALEKRGAPAATTKIASDFIVMCERYREAFYELRASGWKPPSAEGFNPQAGTRVSVGPKFLDLYAWIPGVTGGTADLVVSKVSEGVRPLFLVASVDGTSYGYIPKSHLTPR